MFLYVIPAMAMYSLFSFVLLPYLHNYMYISVAATTVPCDLSQYSSDEANEDVIDYRWLTTFQHDTHAVPINAVRHDNVAQYAPTRPVRTQSTTTGLRNGSRTRAQCPTGQCV